jgi:hypothetical protein
MYFSARFASSRFGIKNALMSVSSGASMLPRHVLSAVLYCVRPDDAVVLICASIKQTCACAK